MQWRRFIQLDVGEPNPLGVPGLGGFQIKSSTDSPDMLRVRFSIEKDEKPWPNSAQIVVWNLNASHRNNLAGLNSVPCRLTAGYRDSSAVIFEGMLRSAPSIHDGTDWATELLAGDGELDEDGEPIAGKSIHKTWSRGTPVFSVLQDFVREMKLAAGNSAIAGAAASVLTGNALTHAYSADGPLLDELNYFMRSCALVWSIQDGAFQVRITETPASVAPLISPLTGLLGEVEKSRRKIERENTITKEKETQTIDVVSGTCLLRPDLLPGQQMILQSRQVTGPYLCYSVTHTGDTHDNDWFTTWEGHA